VSKIYLSLGTNLGDREENLRQALGFLAEAVTIRIESPVYETEPVGFTDQPWFLNMVAEGETALSPEGLLRFTQGVESRMGRVRTIAGGPRIIDIDILLYGDAAVETENLSIPHPRMLERAFVMVPLYAIAADLVISGKSIKDIMADFKGEKISQRG
jgi:2-amino-4-hydroxy-6-hydroxymethyldihydropteridine diphosphokinase